MNKSISLLVLCYITSYAHSAMGFTPNELDHKKLQEINGFIENYQNKNGFHPINPDRLTKIARSLISMVPPSPSFIELECYLESCLYSGFLLWFEHIIEKDQLTNGLYSLSPDQLTNIATSIHSITPSSALFTELEHYLQTCLYTGFLLWYDQLTEAKTDIQDYVRSAKLEQALENGFHSLSPEQLITIAKSFYSSALSSSFAEQEHFLESSLYAGFLLWFAQLVEDDIDISNKLDIKAKRYITKILHKHKLQHSILGSALQAGFRSLSRDLLTGVAKSFYLLDRCLPSLLENGSYLEFGLYRGFSLWFAQQVGKKFVDDNFKYFGFDSFAGLPDTSLDYQLGDWTPGLYAVSLEQVTQYLDEHKADFSTLHLIPGWFSQNLFNNWAIKFGQQNLSIITIDADVYEACNEILQFIEPYLRPGNILLFDDFNNNPRSGILNNFGERKSLTEFLSKHTDIKLIHLFPFGWHGYAFMVTSCAGQTLDEGTIEKVRALIGEPELPKYPIFVE